MKDLLSPKQVARAIGVSESSLKRWCDRGLLPTVRTVGGHRRLPISGVLAFLRSTQQALVAPELLGLPATSGQSDRVVTRSAEQLRDALLAGDEILCRQILFDLWLSGQTLSTLCDDVISASFTEIGEKWACDEADVYEERRACEIMLRILHEIRSGLPAGDPAWTALGGTIAGDQYTLPTTMAELILQDEGWASRSLGTSLPVDSLATAITENRPRLFWVSISYIAEPDTFVRDFATLSQAAEAAGSALVVGGFALQGAIRQQLHYASYCDRMSHLAQLARTLKLNR